MIQRLLLLTALAEVALSHPVEEGELQLVQVVIRHGDRAAQDGYATDKSAEVLFRGNGELSDDGIDNAHQQGFDFKKRYVDQYKLFDERYIPSEVRFRASTVPRVLMSAGSFSNALFKRTRGGNVVVPPIYTKDYNDDALLAPDFSCTNGWDEVQTALNLTNTDNIANDALVAMEQQQWPDSCKDVPANKVDAIIAELPNKAIKMPLAYDKCAMMPAKKFMYDYIELLGGGGDHYNELRLKRTVGMLTQELLDNMDDKVSCASKTDKTGCKTEKFRVYYSHDVNVLALSHVFRSIGTFKKITPAFSSALVLELWKNSKGYHVKIFLKNGQDAEFVYTGLSEEDSKLDNVKKFASKYATKEKVECDKPKKA
ncbi:hypothetical protein PRIPAC_92299 [Pristionchus pacificus]|nr:hypothetical protein PRIPAC_92299 [Pristionchus pacificus]